MNSRSLVVFRYAKRLGLWFWNEPRFLVRFWSAFVPLAALALLIRWIA
jgi:hypothetical protein